MAMFGKAGNAVLNQIGVNLLGVDFAAQKRRAAQLEQKAAFEQGLLRELMPSYAEGPAPTVGRSGGMFGRPSAPMDDPGAAIGSAVGAIAPTAPPAAEPYQYQPPVRTSNGLSMADPRMGAIALQADRMGVPIDALLKVLTAQQPKVSFAPDNTAINEKDPSIIGRSFPKLDAGMMNTPDATGAPRISNAAGYVDAAAEAAGAISGAQERGRAPYSFQTFKGPDGVDNTVSAATAAALGAQGGIIARGQSRPDAIRAEGMATADVERAAAVQGRAAGAGRQLAALDEMERYLPDVISGFGSGVALQSARALAAMGNEDAQRKVTATETFLNQGRVLVADMIKSFGANPTEGERKYAERMSGADAELNPETLREGIRLQRERINRDLQDAGKPAPARTAGGRRPPPAPAATARTANTVYDTPRGPLKWTGSGWVTP